MVAIYSEPRYAAQEERIQALKYARERSQATRTPGPIDLVESAREKLRFLGLQDERVAAIENRGALTPTEPAC